MSSTTGIKLTDDLRARLKDGAERIGRSPHWLMKQALIEALERIERGETAADAILPLDPAGDEGVRPFLHFARSVRPQSVLRARITGAYRRPEPECLPLLMALARQSEPERQATRELATRLVQALRGKDRVGGAEGLLDEYSLSSQEGVALMCLAEALLRIPDAATRDALIRDKISAGDWQAHLGQSPSMFVNAATWGLVLTGKLTTTQSEAGLTNAMVRLIGRGGEPLIRKGVAMAMRMMGEQFVTGQTIAEALANARPREARGFRFSYDMLGEAAMTQADADRYAADYERAIHAIGRASARRGIYEGPGISIKLSALHPRYSRAQQQRVMAELLPRLAHLAGIARSYDIGLNIDAEEADRLELSLDLMEALCLDPALGGWNGLGFVVQAYGKRCPFVIDWLIDLARRARRRIMVRLVKGAYWDSEIKRAQMDGLEGFPVYTRKLYTDVSYQACARRLLAAPEAIYPQFATHNAQTLAAIVTMAGPNYYAGQYEFQCLHGMGEPLYEEVVGADRLNRPCRIYAPVGTHETLLAYLVRRLLENGANSSFVNRVADSEVPIGALVADPVEEVGMLEPPGAPHPRIALPAEMFGVVEQGGRANSAGLDLSNEQRLASLAAATLASLAETYQAAPTFPGAQAAPEPVRNPADRRDTVGHVCFATEACVETALATGAHHAAIWAGTPAGVRADCLVRAADLLEAAMPSLIGLIVREAGKTLPASVSEVREAVDFLRYYARAVRSFAPDTHRPLGLALCISPWNFPLAIFMGQVAACLAAGNAVIAKPAEQTPLIAARAVCLLHEAGVPREVVQLLPGAGEVGAALVADRRIDAVVFTGSTAVARSIQKTLAGRLSAAGQPIPLIAETGGLNAMIVDSSALAEQVVADVLASAFDSAGQRCSALRLLCLQEDIAGRTIAMLHGAARELCIGAPDRLSTDVGPVIDAEAAGAVTAHVERMRAAGFRVTQLTFAGETVHGTFVAPTIIEIGKVADLPGEVFGPVLHVLRFARDEMDALVEQINDTGYGLTFGLHTRIDETIERVTSRIEAGNLYVNRNIIGAVVGVQPFGGEGLSGTGPKAGGPLYVHRLLAKGTAEAPPVGRADPAAQALAAYLEKTGRSEAAASCRAFIARSRLGSETELPGPVGERNLYRLRGLGTVLCLPVSEAGALIQLAATLATGNDALFEAAATLPHDLPDAVVSRVRREPNPAGLAGRFSAALVEEGSARLRTLNRLLAEKPGAIVRLQSAAPAAPAYETDWLLAEQTLTNNVAAAGGNASLMTIG